MKTFSTALLLLASTLLNGCAARPGTPEPPRQPGTIHFLVTGAQDAVSAFQANFAKFKPENCESLTPSSYATPEDPQKALIIYQCAHTNAETFLAVGRAYVETALGSSSAQASLGPTYLAQQSGKPLSVTATTSTCSTQWCALLKSSGPWKKGYECTYYC